MVIMVHPYRRKVFIMLLVLLFLFSFLFLVVVINPNLSLLEIGLPTPLLNGIIGGFSFLSIILVIWEMSKI